MVRKLDIGGQKVATAEMAVAKLRRWCVVIGISYAISCQLCVEVLGQLNLLSPPGLISEYKEKFKVSGTFIKGSTATFGMARYGKVIQGMVVKPPSASELCEDDVVFDSYGRLQPKASLFGPSLHNSTTGNTDFSPQRVSTNSLTGEDPNVEQPASTTTTTHPPTGRRLGSVACDGASKSGIADNCVDRRWSLSTNHSAFPTATDRRHLQASPTTPAIETLHQIFLIRRGGCPFVVKVRRAQQLGAVAVIFVYNHGQIRPTDQVSLGQHPGDETQSDIEQFIITDTNGDGFDIQIPSLLIPFKEGNFLERALERQSETDLNDLSLTETQTGKFGTKVLVELDWNIPRKHMSHVELWLSSGSLRSVSFILQFSGLAKIFGPKLRLDIRSILYSRIIDVDSSCYPSSYSCASNPDFTVDDIANNNPELQAVASSLPPHYFITTGRDVAKEDARQACIFSLYVDSTDSSESFSSFKFWEYAHLWALKCTPFAGTFKPSNTVLDMGEYGTEMLNYDYGGNIQTCSDAVQNAVGIDIDKVNNCLKSHELQTVLQRVAASQAWGLLSTIINGVRFYQTSDMLQLTEALCASLVDKNPECETAADHLRRQRGWIQHVVNATGQPLHSGNLTYFDSSSLLFILVMVCVVLCGSGILYHVYLRKTLNDEISTEFRMIRRDYRELPDEFGHNSQTGRLNDTRELTRHNASVSDYRVPAINPTGH